MNLVFRKGWITVTAELDGDYRAKQGEIELHVSIAALDIIATSASLDGRPSVCANDFGKTMASATKNSIIVFPPPLLCTNANGRFV